MPKEKYFKYIFAAVLLCVFAIMLVFNFVTPLLDDDFAYAFSFSDFERIESIKSIFPSMNAHRSLANGRVVSHFLVQLFMMRPKAVFNAVNAAFSVCILLVMFLFYRSKSAKKNLFILLFSIFALWCYTPDFGQVYLWLDGSCNYSWAVLFTLLFVLPYYLFAEGRYGDKRTVFGILIIPLSLIAGAYSESASLAAIFIAVCFTVKGKIGGEKLEPLLIVGIILAGAGYMYMMSSPAETGEKGVFVISEVFYNLLYVCMSLKFYQITLYCIYIFALVMSLGSHADKSRIITSLIFFVGGLGSILAFSFAKYCPARALCAVTAYTVIASSILIEGLLDRLDRRFMCAALAVLAVIFFGEFTLGTYDIFINKNIAAVRNELIFEAQLSEEKRAEIPKYNSLSKYSAMTGLEDVGDYFGFWVNVAMEKYYDLDYIAAIPTEY